MNWQDQENEIKFKNGLEKFLKGIILNFDGMNYYFVYLDWLFQHPLRMSIGDDFCGRNVFENVWNGFPVNG
jgi:hypothetical protein